MVSKRMKLKQKEIFVVFLFCYSFRLFSWRILEKEKRADSFFYFHSWAPLTKSFARSVIAKFEVTDPTSISSPHTTTTASLSSSRFAAPGLRRFHSAQFFIPFFWIAILGKIRLRILKIQDQEFWILWLRILNVPDQEFCEAEN